jgi:hypothetical protein
VNKTTLTQHCPTKQFALNRSLVDRKDQSNGYNFVSLVDIYFHTCRHFKDFLKIKFSNWMLADCVESFLLTVESFLKGATQSAKDHLLKK